MNTIPFRNLNVIDNLLSNTRLYNVLFVCSHGALAQNESGGTFLPDPNSILLFTGAGKPGFPIRTNKTIEKQWMNLFDPDRIKETFAAFLGLYHGHTELLYKVPNDATPCPELYLSIDATDRTEDIGFWGVFQHTGETHGRRPYSNIKEIPELTAELYGGIFASAMMNRIHEMYSKDNKTNIILFISCRTAPKKGTRISEYTESASIFFEPSHFTLEYVPSGLDKHVPKETEEEKDRILYVQHNDVRIPLSYKDRNQTVKELIAFLRTNYKLFDYDGVKTLLVLKLNPNPKETIVVSLLSDVLFESQWDESYFTTDEFGQKDILMIYPETREVERANTPFRENIFYNPEKLETSVSIAGRKRINRTRNERPSKKGGARKTRTKRVSKHTASKTPSTYQ
jgi:hypothetical protein